MPAMNVSLNPGGFIGAFCGAVVGGVCGYLVFQDRTGGMAKLLVGGLVAGALIGNATWAFLFQPRA